MSLYAWKYEPDGTVVYTSSEEPSSGDSICKENGVAYEEFELHILYNGSVDSTVVPTVRDYYYLYPDTDTPAIKVGALISGSVFGQIIFARYSSGDIFPISKLKHDGVTYEITDEQARNSISNILPTQTGNDGKFLTTNGTTTSWANVDALPSQSGQSGKYLTTNGTTASWATVQAGPKFLTFQNITASTWVSDNTYSEYSYKCVLTCTGVTSSDYAQVIFNPAQSVSGNYANVCLTDTDTVTIYSKVNTAISIPTITVIGSN